MDLERPDIQAGEKIMVAMSGGVDSSAAALLLKEAGFDVVGVTLRFWVDPLAEEGAADDVKGCCSLDAVNDARSVCQTLGIPHYVLNMKDYFYDKVVTYFTSEYFQGRTPNPCIACNRHIKFSLLVEKARALGINYLATGHYSRILYDPKEKIYRLFRGKDREKDQSYMLYTLTQEQLSHVLFPLGNYTKPEIRAFAQEAGLKVAEKAESQEICFIPDNDYRGFLERENPGAVTPGVIISPNGKKIGRHHGLPFYTVGQRKGLGLTSTEPLYVIEIDVKNNVLVVGKEEDTYSEALIADELSFVSGSIPDHPLHAQVKIRYRAPHIPAVLYPPEGENVTNVKIVFAEKQKAVTPGQAVVFYQGEEVLGGGTITSTNQ